MRIIQLAKLVGSIVSRISRASRVGYVCTVVTQVLHCCYKVVTRFLKQLFNGG
jgi:hypothetical protein